MQRRNVINSKPLLRSSMLAAVAAGLLTGCFPFSDDDNESGEPPARSGASEATGSSAPSAPSAAASAPPAAGNAQVTAPGTKLKVGQRAVVPWEYGSTRGTIGITVTAIEPGDVAAFRSRFGAKAASLVPYYIRFTVENVGGTDLSNVGAPRLSAQLSDGSSTGVVLSGSLPDCESGDADGEFSTVGAKFETCTLQAARTGSTITSALFEDELGGYDDRELVWSN
ncbi:hypothetical protein OHR68_33770 [Spirillospora sp. NBC_00431]